LIRKKFFNFWGKWPLPLRFLFDDIGSPEKIRFSFGVELVDGDELKICVIEDDEQLLRELLFVKDDVGESGGLRRVVIHDATSAWLLIKSQIPGFDGGARVRRTLSCHFVNVSLT
jgi:hypothetical protein